jgi:hypothetical protein
VARERSTTARQLAKPVFESRVLDDMESTAKWRAFGPGQMSLTTDRQRDGKQSLRIISPTKTPRPGSVQGRPFGETGVRREFAGEDWSAYNRLSVWVYPDLPGFKVVSLLLKLQSEGTTGRSYTDGGLHFVLLRNGEWNQVTWEIAHLERAQVRGVDLIYRLQGNEAEAADKVTYDFDRLELQRVLPDHFRGWEVEAGRIAYCQAGYSPESPKLAFAAAGAGNRFEVLDAAGGKVVWSGATRIEPDGRTAVMDFSGLTRRGAYRLRLGRVQTEAFPIGGDIWRESLTAGLNFFFCERCGCEVPRIHGVCHQDWQVEQAGRRLPINGGWHDAGDLSQGLVNTSEAVWSMLRLAERIEKRDPELAARFRREAAWGAQWLVDTRFGDGFRVSWATMDFWTDNRTGTTDDVVVKANDSPFDNFLAAAAEAAAARALRELDPVLAGRCQIAAEADHQFALAKTRDPGVELAGAATQASIELYRLAGRLDYLTAANRFADVLLKSQQIEKPAWDRPLSGFFHTSPRRDRILHYNHRSHEQAPAVALTDLALLVPDHENAAAWREAVRRYGEYLLEAAKLNSPYHLCAAGIYRLADTSDANQREQIRQGLKLAEGIYLRRFPVWGDFRGNLGVQLSQATAAASAARLLDSEALRNLAREQLEWTLGRNPFCQSLMYGVGHNYAPQYTAMSGDITGSLPVGIQSRLEEDVPYYPASNCYNYAEVWVHPVSRWFSALAELEP